jgi:magnesium transporter
MSDRTLGDPPTISVAVGITVGLIASFVQSAGLTLQRKSHLQNELIPEAQRKPETRRP